MKLALISDTHSDAVLLNGTTKSSSGKLQRLRHEVAMNLVGEALQQGYAVVHAGDLFNRAQFSSAKGLGFALELVEVCDYILAGNHDVTKSIDTSIFQAATAIPSVAKKLVVGRYADAETGATLLYPGVYAIPEVSTQKHFERILNTLIAETEPGENVLILHCGILLKDEWITENMLNLNESWMDILAKHFKRVFVGHNHGHATYKKGKIISIGTQVPMSFADLPNPSAKFGMLLYDTDTDNLGTLGHKTYGVTLQTEKPERNLPPFVRVAFKPENITEYLPGLLKQGALAVKFEQITDLADDDNELLSEEVPTLDADAVVQKVLNLLSSGSKKLLLEVL